MIKAKKFIVSKPLVLAIITVTLISSCVEEFWPDLDGSAEKILVVNGKITNHPGPYTITLTRTGILDSVPYSTDADYDFKGVSGATISIIDDIGNSEILTETEAGVYKTSVDGIQGVIGNSYKITINTADGNFYESDFQKLLPPLNIDMVKSVEEQTTNFIDGEEVTDLGLRFYITSDVADNNNKYIYWEIENTYEYHAQYMIEHIYEGYFEGGEAYPHPPFNVPVAKKPDSLFYCYKTDPVYEVFTYDLNKLATPKVVDFPLNFISYDDEKMEFKYSLNVKQLTVTKDAQDYMRKLAEQNSGQDGLYASLPYQIRGNISNTERPDETVLGFFMAASYSEMEHSFYKAPEKPIFPDTFQICKVLEWELEPPYEDDAETRLLKYLKYYINPNFYPVYLTTAWVCINCWERGPAPADRIYRIRFAAVDDACVDCRLRKLNGTIEKPDYWIWD